MALGGGTFLVQNKILPGAYINFVSRPRALGSLGERGTAAMLLQLDWGAEGEVFTVEAADFQKDSLKIFGYAYTDEKMLYLREVFKGAKTLKLYRPKSGAKAKATVGSLTATAKCGGSRGNQIKVSVEQTIDDEMLFEVITFIGADNAVVDVQTVKSIAELVNNDFVSFSGSIALIETAATVLTGGMDIAVTGNDYSLFLDKIEAEDFNTLLYPGTDIVTKALFDSFTKRLRDSEGYKITTVLYDYPKADFEGVISVKNKADDTNEAALVYWVAGKSAGAAVNESLTNRRYDGELVIDTKYKKSEFTVALQNSEFAFYGEKTDVKVLADINTFISITPLKNADFGNNQIIRVLDEIANGTARIFDAYYLGKVQNSATGRNLLKAELIHYHDQLQSIDAITNFSAEDIEIAQGTEKGDVVVAEAVQPVGTMDKLYMTVNVI